MLRFAAALLAPAAAAAQPAPEFLWPGVPPGDENVTLGPEEDSGGRAYNVSRPTMQWFPVNNSFDGPRSAVLVFPGGGYRLLAYDKEGYQVAAWLNSLGIHAAVVKYRVPDRGYRQGLPPYWAPLMDAQRAAGILRSRASELNIRPDSIGVIGFSAGGNLVAHLSTAWRNRIYKPIDASDQQSCRPDFAMMGYPWRLLDNTSDVLSVHDWLPVGKDTPAAWMVHSSDDPTAPVTNSLGWALALRAAGVKPMPEFHVYPEGGHGFGLCPDKQTWEICKWPSVAAEWLKATSRM